MRVRLLYNSGVEDVVCGMAAKIDITRVNGATGHIYIENDN